MTLPLSDSSLLKTQAYINGTWLSASPEETLAVTNPATGEVLAHVAKVGAAETQHAIDAAQFAMQSWQLQSAKTRANILRRWFDLVMANQEDLAIIMTAEQGKTLAERVEEK